MTYHKFSLSESSFEENKVDLGKHRGDITENNLYKSSFGYSLSQVQKKLGFGEKKTLKYLKLKKVEGKVRVIRVPILDITNRLNYSTVYILEMELNGTQE